MKLQNSRRRGGVGRTALGLLAMGCGSALFGALVVGPRLGEQIEPRVARAPEPAAGLIPTARRESPPAPEATRDTRPAKPPAVKVRESREPGPATDDADREYIPPEGGAPAEADGGLLVEAESRDGDRSPGESAPSRRARERRRDHAPETDRATAPAGDREPAREARAPSRRPEERRSEERRSTQREPRPRGEGGRGPVSSLAQALEAAARAERESPPRRPALEGGDRKPAVRSAASPPRPAVVPPAPPAAPAEAGAEAREEARVFAVRVGRYRTREEAQQALDEVSGATGVGGFPIPAGDGFRLQMGVYRRRENADKVAAALRDLQLRPEVTEERRAVRRAPAEGAVP